MKITIVCGFFLPVPPLAGGAMEKGWWRIAQHYVRLGHEVTIVSRRWPGLPDTEVREGIRLLRYPGANHTRKLWRNLLLDAIWGLRVLRHLPAADILITNTVALPVFVRRLRPQAGALVVNLNRHPKGQLRWYAGVARVQAASGAIAAAARQQCPALGDVIRVVPNPVDCRAFQRPVAARPANDVLTIGFIGRLHPEKGLANLVRAAAILAARPELPLWSLQLRGPVDVARGGGGEDFVAHLRAVAPALWESDRIRIAPPLFDADKLTAAYHELDIFCYPTEAAEGEAHPVAVLEAMASGLPVVATQLPCFADQIVDGRNALLIPLRDPVALAAALARLLTDPATRATLARNAEATVSTLDDEVVARQHLADFANLIHDCRH